MNTIEQESNESNKLQTLRNFVPKPSQAFVTISWVALTVGLLSYLIGLWNADMDMSTKGFYLIVLLYGMFGTISVQKAVRDKLEGVKITNAYSGLSWFSALSAVALLIIGLWNSRLLALSEKGFYALSYLMSLFASIAVQKNTRDLDLSSS